MDPSDKLLLTCDLMIRFLESWSDAFCETPQMSRDTYFIMFTYIYNQNAKEVSLTHGELSKFLSKTLKCSDRVTQDYIKRASDCGYIEIVVDLNDGRKKNVFASEKLLKQLDSFATNYFSDFSELAAPYSMDINLEAERRLEVSNETLWRKTNE